MIRGRLAGPIVGLLVAAGCWPAATAAQGFGPVTAASLREAIDRAAPGDTIDVQGGRLAGPLVVGKRVELRGHGNPVIDGRGSGTVLTLAAQGIVLSGFTITSSGASLLQDDAAVLVTADDVTVRDSRIEDALHGIYVLRANHFRLLRNRIHGKPAINDENRGNGIHLHSSSDGVIEDNEISEVRDGVYFNYADRNRVTRLRAMRLRSA